MRHSKRDTAGSGGRHVPPPLPKKKKKKKRPNLSVNLKCQGETASEMQRLNVNEWHKNMLGRPQSVEFTAHVWICFPNGLSLIITDPRAQALD